ncbi:hypothetical protein OC834_000267 [Tilletia horrida]|nr:hypothetical protein OC834_000267 [Tilletia horrida]KAK0540238.1 hypothetical protein OC835_000769 [Tilletia horrida]
MDPPPHQDSSSSSSASQAQPLAPAPSSAGAGADTSPYHRLHTWDWNHDGTFQAGIASIVSPLRAGGRSEEEVEKVVRRAQVFYFGQQTGEQVTPEGYAAWLSAQGLSPSSGSTSAASASAPAPGTSSSYSSTAQGQAQPAALPEQDGEEDDSREPYPASFDAIAELIATGRVDQIPGIRDIPLEISEEPPSEAKLAPRPKPWEQQQSPSAAPSSAGGGAAAPAPAPTTAEPAGFETVAETEVLQQQ